MKKSVTIAAVALGLGLATQASAHATFEQKEAVQGQRTKLTVRIGHGCGDEATLRLRVAIPEGVIRVQPGVHPGWTVEGITGPYENSYEDRGATLTEGIREIVWEGELPSGLYDEFIFRAVFSDQLPAGEPVYIPVVQECANGAARWIEIPAEGQTRSDLESPAPSITVVAPAPAGN
ncbi:YcnI family protein [Paracoccus sp. (in: a-proteobacteria)]|uniref:YcnI family copper-binding membrane protein n=1 Tax=Paracoccus sp. TaxID=267 RepID=UPI003A8C361D